MEFRFEDFIYGLIIAVVGILLVRFYREISDNMLSGVSSYDRTRLLGIGIITLGLLYSFGIFQFILIELIKLMFPSIT